MGVGAPRSRGAGGAGGLVKGAGELGLKAGLGRMERGTAAARRTRVRPCLRGWGWEHTHKPEQHLHLLPPAPEGGPYGGRMGPPVPAWL